MLYAIISSRIHKMIHKIKNIIRKKFTKNYWQSSMSKNWHNKRKNASVYDFDTFAEATCKRIEGLNIDTIIEVGTGAGTLITLLSKKLHTCNKFIGIDINKQQIADNKKNYKDLTNVEFVYMNIEQYIRANNFNHTVFVSQNTLDYFEKNELEKLFLLIYTKIENVVIVINTYTRNINLQDSIERKDANLKVYDHNYYFLLQSAGYELVTIDPLNEQEDAIVIAGYKQNK